MQANQYIFKEESYNIIGCAMEVHNELGHGFLEAVYQEAFEFVLKQGGIPYEREKILEINFKNTILRKKYIADFFCYGNIIVELKATKSLDGNNIAQVLNYLKATKTKLGLLINFGTKSLEYKRIVF